jgi:hypothetical protein
MGSDEGSLFPACYLQGVVQPQRVVPGYANRDQKQTMPALSRFTMCVRIGPTPDIWGGRKGQPADVENRRGRRSIVSDCFYQWKKQVERVRR